MDHLLKMASEGLYPEALFFEMFTRQTDFFS